MQTSRGATRVTVWSTCQVPLTITSVPLLTELHAACDAALAFCNSTSFLQCGRTHAWYYYSTVLPPCSVMRQCIFMKIQLRLSHTIVECKNKFLNAVWQLQTTIRHRLLGQRNSILCFLGIPMATLSCLISEPCLLFTWTARNKRLNLTYTITFLLKYTVCGLYD